MSVYVDPMVNYGRRIGRAGPRWCHMIADTLAELHAVADEIGLLRRWFQATGSAPHYDLGTDRMRVRAIAAGAIECERDTFTRHKRRIQKRCPECGYPTADGGHCGECLCEDDCAP